jgi:MFS family permease
MKPILSIGLALLTTVLLFILNIVILTAFGISGVFSGALSIFIGGIIATWFSSENKVKYSIYFGIIFAFIYSFIFSILLDILFFVVVVVTFIILAGIGGFIAKKIKETDNKKTRTILTAGTIGITLVLIIVSAFTSIGNDISISKSSESNAFTPTIPQIVSDTSTLTDLKNGSYEVSGLLKNNANKNYTNVEIIVTGYDINRIKIVESKYLIAKIKANSTSHYNIILTPPEGKLIEYFPVNVLNATANEN